MKSNIAKSALWVTVSEIFFNLSGFIIHSALGRFMGPTSYGRYGLIITLTTTVIILIGNGVPTAMAKYISEYFEKDAKMVLAIKKQAIFLQATIIGAITLIFYLSIPLISRALGDMTLVPLFRISTLIIPAFALASFYFSFYTGLHRFNLQATLKTVRSIARILFVISLAYFFSVEGSIIGYVLAPGSVFIVAYLIDKFKISKELTERAALQAKDYQPVFEAKKLINYAWQIIFFFLAYELLISIDLYLVKGILLDDKLTGIYNATLTVGRIPYYIFYAMTIFLLPLISKSTAEKNHQKTSEILNQSLRLMLILLVPMIILMSVFAKPILLDFYGKNYLAGAPAMAILEYGVGFLTIFYVLSFAMNGAGKTKISMWISLFGVILNTVLNYFLIKKFSIVGSASATTITSFIIMLMMLYYLYREFGVLIRLKSLLKTFFAGILLYLFATQFSQGPIIFIFWSLLLFGIYLALLYAMGEINKKDLGYIQGLLKRKKTKKMEEAFSGNEPEA
ncbi:MAG: flippase [Candidatus Moraniibacteriota bacterium]